MMCWRRVWVPTLILILGACASEGPAVVDYNLHVQPILSDRCYKCHGPDDNTREADMRLDTYEGYVAGSRLDSTRLIVAPGAPAASELIRRVSSSDPQVQMPPPESNLSLTETEIKVLERWIAQGATWKPHWAFIPPVRPDKPAVKHNDWPLDDLDYYTLARMEAADMRPSPMAPKEHWLRRVTFDVTGLPPTEAELAAFLADNAEDGFERVVNTLLSRPGFGERMASEWLDAARYADTHGYQDDRPRTMWPWRDWVVNAYNQGMPYDSFLTWQLAGDLLPDASYQQKLATGFSRNHAITQEGGVIPLEYLTEYAADRTNTTATAFLGLTMECARCHDHKFDPISQRDYYSFTAFFSTIDEQAPISYFDLAPSPSLRHEDPGLESQIQNTSNRLEAVETDLAIKAADPSTPAPEAADPGRLLDSLLVSHFPLDTLMGLHTPDSRAHGLPAQANTGLEADLDTLAMVDGHYGQAVSFDGTNFLSLGREADFEWYDRFSFGGWVHAPRRSTDIALFSKRIGEQGRRGYDLVLSSTGQLIARLTHDATNAVVARSTLSVAKDTWTHVFLTYDGSGRAGGIRLYIDGRMAPTVMAEDALDQHSILNGNELLAGHWSPRLKTLPDITGLKGGAMDEVRVYARDLTPVEVTYLAGANRSNATARRHHYLEQSDPSYRALRQQADSLRREIRTVPHVMVMAESTSPRTTYILDRGAYDAPLDSVGAGTPASIGPQGMGFQPDRLGLAEWMTHASNPLTARVAVNRYWQMFFGNGLVTTPEDFGRQGALPTHPMLLDYLAVEFVQSGWDIKGLVRRIVLSATYRQVRRYDARDPANTFLARGPEKRLSAEMVRDAALAASGLLDDRVGGPPVFPYQPAGLWKALANQVGQNRYRPSRRGDLYRRSIYTYWKRTIPPPSMLTLDAAERTVCTVKRHATATPLQALVLLNDPQYLEAARVLAESIWEYGEQATAIAFRHFTSRLPEEEELANLQMLRREQEARYRANPEDALALLGVGAYPTSHELDAAMLAALTFTISAIMNLDEAQFR